MSKVEPWFKQDYPKVQIEIVFPMVLLVFPIWKWQIKGCCGLISCTSLVIIIFENWNIKQMV